MSDLGFRGFHLMWGLNMELLCLCAGCGQFCCLFFFFFNFDVKNPACITWIQDKGSCYSLMEMRIPWVLAKVCHQPSRTPDNWFHFLILQVSPISYEIRAMEDLNVLLKVLFCRLKKPWQHKATTLNITRQTWVSYCLWNICGVG